MSLSSDNNINQAKDFGQTNGIYLQHFIPTNSSSKPGFTSNKQIFDKTSSEHQSITIIKHLNLY